MEKIFDLGVKAYAAAAQPKQANFIEIAVMVFETIVDVIKVLVLSIPCWIEALVFSFLSRPKKSIAGQVALVTGAGNGIGREMALRLAREGCKIAVVDIELNAAKRTAQEIIKNNGIAMSYHMDITDYENIEGLRLKVEKDLGPVDILINNAAILPLVSLQEGTTREIQRIVDVNLTANLIITRTFLKSMQHRRLGHILNMSSLSAIYPIAGAVTYSATKSGVSAFSEALSEELRQDGFGDCIHITSVHPYFVASRADLMEKIQLRYRALRVDYVANTAIDGMLRNKLHVSVPAYDRFFVGILRTLPYKVQHLVRDYIIRESVVRAYSKSKSSQ